MNVLIASTRMKEKEPFDSFYAFSSIPLIKSTYMKHKINFAVPVFLYYYFVRFKIIDKTMVNIYINSKASYLDYPIQIVGKFQNDEIFKKDYYKYLLEKEQADVNLFETVEFHLQEKRTEKILRMVKYENTDSVMCVNYVGHELKSNYARFVISFKPIVEPYINETGSCVISLWDLFQIVNKFDYYIGDRKIGQFFSSLSKSKKILIGEGDDINSDIRYYHYARKYLGIDKYDVSYVDDNFEQNIEGLIHDSKQ